MDMFIWIAQWKVFIDFIGYPSCIVEQHGEGTLAEFTNNKSQCSQSNRFRRTEDVICGDGMDGMIV